MEEKEFILFEAYLLGSLSEEEQLSFENRLKTDTVVLQSFNTYKELSGFLDDKFNPEKSTKAFEENLTNVSDGYFNKETKTKVIKFRPWQYAVAASIVLFLGITIFNNFGGNPNYSEFAIHETLSLTERGAQNQLYLNAEKAFNSKNYIEAERLFSEILESNHNQVEVELYKAISLIETNQFIEAENMLLIIADQGSAYKFTAKWYLALSKLKQKEYNACVALLKEIPEDVEVYKKAQKLLSKL